MKNKVLCHVAGPSGSGKTTLLLRIANLFPTIVTKDLDDFDDECSKVLGLDSVKKKNWSDKNLKKLADLRQKFMDNFIDANANKLIIFAGHHTEDKHTLSIPTLNKFLLNVDAETSAKQAYKRSQTEKLEHRRTWEELSSDIREAQEEIDARVKEGYILKTSDEIITWINLHLTRQ